MFMVDTVVVNDGQDWLVMFQNGEALLVAVNHDYIILMASDRYIYASIST